MTSINWNETYTNISPKLLGICRRYIKDIATAEDIVQDSFITAIQKESELKTKDSLNSWLSRIVINRAINYLKKEHIVNYSDTNTLEFIDETTEMNIVALDNKSAILASDFSQEDLLEAIDSLSENHKSVFNLYIIDQFSHIEISKLLNISVGTSKSSLSRARKNIQHFLIEKLNQTKTDDKKKRRIAFLLFLGFGNSLFANYFRKSFATYEIKPKNAFVSSKEIENIETRFLIKPNYLFTFLKFGALFFGLIVFFFFFFNEKNTPVSTIEKPAIEKTFITSEPIKTIDSINKDTVIQKLDLKKENVALKNNNAQIKPKEEIETPKIIAKKDSIVEPIAPKVVVIKKQIIKKDTVYVEKN
jgi:RNA polymerase sigma factor (sigma-70 family)